MAGDPWIGNSGLTHVPIDWSGPNGLIEADKDFIYDPGATSSAVTPSNARGRGLGFMGAKTSDTHAGPVTTPTWGGGTMKFKVKNADGSDGIVECSTIVSESQFNILGRDQLTDIVEFRTPDPVLVKGARPSWMHGG